MLACVMCGERYNVDDVAKGRYFASTGACLLCYQKLYRSDLNCFGDRKVYDKRSVACRSECPDSRICRVFIKHPHDSMRTR